MMADQPMTDSNSPDDPMYDAWLADRRAAEPTGEMIDRLMIAVQQRDPPEAQSLRLAERLNQSRSARWAACVAALVVGSLPFLFVAHVAELLVF